MGIIGFGAIGRLHYQACQQTPGLRVAAISQRTPDPNSPTGVPCFRDYRELLERDDIDVVAICTPSGSHAEAAGAALEHGKHVVVEKPFALGVDQVETLLAMAGERDLRLIAIAQKRYEPQNQMIKTLIESGRIGRPVLGEVLVRWDRDQRYYDQASWRGTLEGDGGVLFNQAYHAIDLLCWFFGAPVRARGEAATLGHDIEAEDTAVATVCFTGGALGVISATTCARPGLPEELNLFFDRGHLSLSGTYVSAWEFPDIPRPELAWADAGSGAANPTAIGVRGLQAQWEDIASALRAGRPPAVTAADALVTIATIVAARRPAPLPKGSHIQSFTLKM